MKRVRGWGMSEIRCVKCHEVVVDNGHVCWFPIIMSDKEIKEKFDGVNDYLIRNDAQ